MLRCIARGSVVSTQSTHVRMSVQSSFSGNTILSGIHGLVVTTAPSDGLIHSSDGRSGSRSHGTCGVGRPSGTGPTIAPSSPAVESPGPEEFLPLQAWNKSKRLSLIHI